ncbi:MAG: nucleotide exchange factor GrpE [Tissierellia bacterium]|nr:nucleotide exchange factor GrpE [Tissierellia bacterium]
MTNDKEFLEEEREEGTSSMDMDQDETLKEGEVEEDETESLRNQLIRLQADFTNFRTRARKAEAESVGLGVEKMAEELFPILDNFEIALSHIDDQKVHEGMKMIYDQLLEALHSKDIIPMDSDGAEFDPNKHYAVWVEEVEGEPSGLVIETIKRGYMRGEKVLQPAMVKVSK